MILGVQLFGVLFGLFMFYTTFLHFKRKEFTSGEMVFWTFTWVSFLIIAIFPTLLTPVIESMHIARLMDLFIICGFIFLLTIVFHIYGIVRTLQKKNEIIVRAIAIEKIDKRIK